jgi:hypothetical protein
MTSSDTVAVARALLSRIRSIRHHAEIAETIGDYDELLCAYDEAVGQFHQLPQWARDEALAEDKAAA